MLDNLIKDLKKDKRSVLDKIMYVVGYTKYNDNITKMEVLELIQRIYRKEL